MGNITSDISNNHLLKELWNLYFIIFQIEAAFNEQKGESIFYVENSIKKVIAIFPQKALSFLDNNLLCMISFLIKYQKFP